MKIHVLSGFLGSGKTTAILQAYPLLSGRGLKVAVITNDQGSRLVDGDFFSQQGIPGREVVNGCFCCNYNPLSEGIRSLVNEMKPDIVFAESVGSCTDIVATVLKPLLREFNETQVTLSTFADIRLLHLLMNTNPFLFEDQVKYIYFRQLEEAEIIVITKIDQISPSLLSGLSKQIGEKYPGKQILFQNSLDPASLQRWINALDHHPWRAWPLSIQVDYDMYARGESLLAWFDQELEFTCGSRQASQAALDLIGSMAKKIRRSGYPVGHLKFLLNGKTKISLAALDELPGQIAPDSAYLATLLVNARVQASPEEVAELVRDCITETEKSSGCRIVTRSQSCFQPGYPKPSFRVMD